MRRSVQIDGLAYDGGIGSELAPPIGIRQQSDWRGTARLLGSEKPSHGGLHAENLEEVANDFDARCRLGLPAAGEAEIIRCGESLVSGDVLIGAALSAKFFVGIGREGRAGPGRMQMAAGRSIPTHARWEKAAGARAEC